MSELNKNMIDMYDVDVDAVKNMITINTPAYISIRNYEIEFIEDVCVIIKNDKVAVTLWNEQKIQHVTVFDF